MAHKVHSRTHVMVSAASPHLTCQGVSISSLLTAQAHQLSSMYHVSPSRRQGVTEDACSIDGASVDSTIPAPSVGPQSALPLRGGPTARASSGLG
jgi:hypothetical protein